VLSLSLLTLIHIVGITLTSVLVLGSCNRGDKVVYDSYNTPKMPQVKLNYVEEQRIRGATQEPVFHDDMSFAALGQDLFNFHGIGGDSDE